MASVLRGHAFGSAKMATEYRGHGTQCTRSRRAGDCYLTDPNSGSDNYAPTEMPGPAFILALTRWRW